MLNFTRFETNLKCKSFVKIATKIVKMDSNFVVTCSIIYIEDIPYYKSHLIASKYFVIIKIERQRIYEQLTISK